MASVWLEVALNGPWTRAKQPRIPVRADEIVEQAIACAGEGAAIVHFHPYDAETGRQRDDYELYAPIIERIRTRTDTICYGTLPSFDAGAAGRAEAKPLSATQRFSAVDKLVRAGLLEWSVVDPGSTHVTTYADLAAGKEGFIYANPESHIRHGLALAQQFRITPSFAIYEPGFLRLGAALHRAYDGAPVPLYRFMFSQLFAFGFPPADWALEAYLKLLAAGAPGAPWMVAGLGVEIEPLIELTVSRGGHVRVGLEDAPFGTDVDNRARVDNARRLIQSAGGTPASPALVRAALNPRP